MRENAVMVRLNDQELARLDEIRGATTRAAHLRRLLYEPPGADEIATRSEVLGLLSRAARSGSVTAAITLLRALRPDDGITVEEELNRLLGD